ncbi:cation transporter [Winogradskyella sp. DF17]|uniref:Cation transporter n=1 Tax=Winogradskyella pelagia TaxID=2819984 RepID=A0ABS3SZI5_9FLAO|nr:heavy metal-associated domain-containing protein [Winogradskyella sp. DF17]MBO3115887.1 cation transporter [Winogradskyella sp. DF17]
MTHIYKVTGMTCNGCKASVESSLSTLDAVENVAVNLEKEEVEISMSKHLNLQQLQEVLTDKYNISKVQESNVFEQNSTVKPQDQNELKQLFPLVLIFGYITVSASLLNMKMWNTTDFMLDFMGLFYIVFSFFKLLDLKGFPESFRMYDPLAKQLPIYGWVYPFIEIALGLLFLFRYKIDIALILTLIILGITTVGVTRSLVDKKSIRCACLGTALNLPMTKATFIENSIMIIMAVVMLFKTF